MTYVILECIIIIYLLVWKCFQSKESWEMSSHLKYDTHLFYECSTHLILVFQLETWSIVKWALALTQVILGSNLYPILTLLNRDKLINSVSSVEFNKTTKQLHWNILIIYLFIYVYACICGYINIYTYYIFIYMICVCVCMHLWYWIYK